MRFVGNFQFGVYLSLAFQTGTELFLILERLAVLFLGVCKLLFRLLRPQYSHISVHKASLSRDTAEYAAVLQLGKSLLHRIRIYGKFRREGARPHLSVTSQRHGDAFHISFTDDGVGFDDKYADRIFFTTDNPDFDDPGEIASRLAHAAAEGGDRSLVHAAVALDPLTGAVLTLPAIRRMTNEMFDAEAEWLPQFGRARA